MGAMPERILKYILIAVAAIVAACSTTRVIPEGESRLKENNIKITNSRSYQTSELEPYLKQKPNTYFIFGWNPFLNVYNWQNGKDGGWDRFVKKIGQEPVIFDPLLVESSKENIKNHLTYQGYYNSKVTDKVITVNRKTTVDYNVTLGRQYPVSEITYNIPDTLLAKSFYNDSLQNVIKQGEYLSEEYLGNSSEEISTTLRNRGFYGFSKNYFFFTADTLHKGGNAHLKVDIKN